jgi:hypothetical protein
VLDPIELETLYENFIRKIGDSSHDGITDVDLKFLHDAGLLDGMNVEEEQEDITQYFHVLESLEKVTLFNEQFLVWIVPLLEEDNPATYVLIAFNHPNLPTLEVVFTTKGVYNTPRYVLKVLQYFLNDLIETQQAILSIEKSN